MQPDLLGHLKLDASLEVFTPDRRDAAMTYVGLRCACGGAVFHLSGWPRVASGRGGLFWRSLARVWREARVPMQNGEPVESPLWLPIFARCDACGREEKIFGGAAIAGRLSADAQNEPRESLRCRVCRRGSVELVAGWTSAGDGGGDGDGYGEGGYGPNTGQGIAIEIVTRCHRCHRQARVAWSDGRPSDQEIRLDLLYGRR